MKTRFRASVVVVHAGKMLVVRLQDPTSREVRTYVPGGGIEPGESAAEAGARETWEEAGYRVEVDPESLVVRRYDFLWDGKLVDCHTSFFRGVLREPWTPPGPVEDTAYHCGVDWLPLAEVAAVFGYHSIILSAIHEINEKHHHHLFQ